MKAKYSLKDFSKFKLEMCFEYNLDKDKEIMAAFLTCTKDEMETFEKGGPELWKKKFKYEIEAIAQLTLNGKNIKQVSGGTIAKITPATRF